MEPGNDPRRNEPPVPTMPMTAAPWARKSDTLGMQTLPRRKKLHLRLDVVITFLRCRSKLATLPCSARQTNRDNIAVQMC